MQSGSSVGTLHRQAQVVLFSFHLVFLNMASLDLLFGSHDCYVRSFSPSFFLPCRAYCSRAVDAPPLPPIPPLPFVFFSTLFLIRNFPLPTSAPPTQPVPLDSPPSMILLPFFLIPPPPAAGRHKAAKSFLKLICPYASFLIFGCLVLTL